MYISPELWLTSFIRQLSSVMKSERISDILRINNQLLEVKTTQIGV